MPNNEVTLLQSSETICPQIIATFFNHTTKYCVFPFFRLHVQLYIYMYTFFLSPSLSFCTHVSNQQPLVLSKSNFTQYTRFVLISSFFSSFFLFFYSLSLWNYIYISFCAEYTTKSKLHMAFIQYIQLYILLKHVVKIISSKKLDILQTMFFALKTKSLRDGGKYT